jgi:hypothetical protein
MTRTQIQLPDELYLRAKRVAAQRELSMAEMTRRGLELFLARLADAPASAADWTFPVVNCGGTKVPLEKLHDISADEESSRGLAH